VNALLADLDGTTFIAEIAYPPPRNIEVAVPRYSANERPPVSLAAPLWDIARYNLVMLSLAGELPGEVADPPLAFYDRLVDLGGIR
jgi:hypothetical protein